MQDFLGPSTNSNLVFTIHTYYTGICIDPRKCQHLSIAIILDTLYSGLSSLLNINQYFINPYDRIPLISYWDALNFNMDQPHFRLWGFRILAFACWTTTKIYGNPISQHTSETKTLVYSSTGERPGFLEHHRTPPQDDSAAFVKCGDGIACGWHPSYTPENESWTINSQTHSIHVWYIYLQLP